MIYVYHCWKHHSIVKITTFILCCKINEFIFHFRIALLVIVKSQYIIIITIHMPMNSADRHAKFTVSFTRHMHLQAVTHSFIHDLATKWNKLLIKKSGAIFGMKLSVVATY